ncbi:MAG: ABC transporter permease [Gemmatimonadaceae bacterium]|nr:ABC transporter permease [Gemmatimonadaceae bacterium]NUO94805.1 ABC transporter permease [Gemmatimonadaceae bacterium]NUP72899.1 ABC transporter permease [Gemmatimonadaceae bacterium]NUR35637.1 ABC transporter permease [Gemmatimonadaceae bacterium]NUS32489.1 ABC transporter permease [Gemmatimonadaceae bacterium]
MSAAPPASGPIRRIARRLSGDARARTAVVVLLVVVAAALLAPVLAPYDPAAQLDIVRLKSQPPSWAHPLGTDPYSRDVLSRLLWGSRISLAVAFIAVTLSMTIGVAVGAIAGYAGGAVDAVLMRLVDTALSVPRLLLLIGVVALWSNVGIAALTLLLAGTGWFTVSRLTRAETLVVREREFVVAARMLGASPWRILSRHILPNVVGPAFVAATLGIANVILLEAGLSYLGIGVRAPAASWGGIIQDGAERVADLWWLTLFPGLAILITVFACNALGDALRDALDPRQLAPSLDDDIPHRTR